MRTARLLALVALIYLLGFAGFMFTLGGPLDPALATDAIVVPTGGPGRIQHGLELLGRHRAKRMLITGADPTVRPAALAVAYRAPALFSCCVDVGYEAVDTRSNADETATWLREHRYTSVRLVTSEWHLPRARMELNHALAGHATVLGDAVPSSPAFTMLIAEYNKYLLRRAALLVGYGP